MVVRSRINARDLKYSRSIPTRPHIDLRSRSIQAELVQSSNPGRTSTNQRLQWHLLPRRSPVGDTVLLHGGAAR
jgi:hypothetical protein